MPLSSLHLRPTLFRSTGLPPLANFRQCLRAVLKGSLSGMVGCSLLYFHLLISLGVVLTGIGALFTLPLGLVGVGIGIYAGVTGQQGWWRCLLMGLMSVVVGLCFCWVVWQRYA
ncbi:MAG: hypothetical protein M3Y56_12410 [Armatimonadota bacterium]|nr:hypothetical protein [Armatimonadota bacterium]